VTEMPLQSVLTCAQQIDADENFLNFKKYFAEEATKETSDLAQLIRSKSEKLEPLCPSYRNLTKLFEQKSLAQSILQKVYQGAVYQTAGSTKKIYICISQACDCSHKEVVLLLEGKVDPKFEKTAPGRTNVSFGERNYAVIPNAESCFTGKVLEPKASRCGIEGLEYVGGLRASVVMRIADRFFSHQTRVGVNQPAIIRELRQNS
jgi:hypothetical protein